MPLLARPNLSRIIRRAAVAAAALVLATAGLAARSSQPSGPTDIARAQAVSAPAAASAGPPAAVAWHAVAPPTGPDMRAVQLAPRPARAPRPGAWVATVRQRQRFLAPAQEQGRPPVVQVSRDGTTEGASRPVTDFSEVMLAADPTDPDHLLGSSKFFHTPARYGFYTGVFESFDGGRTWSQEQPPGVEDYRLTSDPVNTFDHEGAGYFTLLTRNPSYSGLDMLKKPAGGDWEPPVTVDDSTVTDKQWIVGDQDPLELSPFAGHLYMSWTDVGRNRGIVLSRSTDGNATWSPPVVVERGAVQGSVPAVAPDGTLYVLWGRDIFGAERGQLRLARSDDAGASFDEPRRVAVVTPIPFLLPNGLDDRNFRSPASLPAFAVSPLDGRLYASWADARHGDADIYLTWSSDGGLTWTGPRRMNDDPRGNGVDQIHPQLAVAPDGRVALSWLDRRLPCPAVQAVAAEHHGRENFCLEAFMTRSYDGGASWTGNLRLGRQAFDWSVNLPIVSTDDGFSVGFIGDYQGLASTAQADIAFWAATSDLGQNPRHRQQVFAAIVPAGAFDPPPAASPPPPTTTPDATPTKDASPTTAATATPTTVATPPPPAALHLPVGLADAALR